MSKFVDGSFITPDILESLLKSILCFILLLSNERGKAFLNSSVCNLESSNRLLKTHGNGVEVLDFINLTLETKADLHLLAAVKSSTEINTIEVNLSLMKVE